MKYALKRTNGPGYVAISGNGSSYTNNLRRIRIFESYEEAVRNACIGNEVPVKVDDIFTWSR
jgi:hypothetical protein